MDARTRETNVCFVVLFKSFLSEVYVSAEPEGFCGQNFDEVLVSGPVPSQPLGKYPTVHQPSQKTGTMLCIEDVTLAVERGLL